MSKNKCCPHIISMVGRDWANYHKNLHDGFDQLGIENHFFFERSHPFYKYTRNRGVLEKSITCLNDVILKKNMPKPYKWVSLCFLYPVVIAFKIILFFYFLKKYDVFIFTANYSFLGLYSERVFLKMAGKIIIDPVCGSDVRPPYLNGGYIDKACWKIRLDTFLKYKRVQYKLKFSSFNIDHPTVSQFHNKQYIPHLYIGFPIYLSAQPVEQSRKKPLIIHAPSNPKIKGTEIIREVIQDLKNHYDFDYEELSGVPHDTVIKKIQQSSFVINQLYSDTPMSGLDTEAAWLGKASIVGGYNLDMIVETMKGWEVPPTYRIYPSKENLKKAIVHLLTDTKYCEDLGRSAENFVKTSWNSKTVAQKYLDIINGDVPSSIIRTGKHDFDIYGAGISDSDRKQLIKLMVSKYGEKSLCLENKPQLKAMLLKDCGLID